MIDLSPQANHLLNVNNVQFGYSSLIPIASFDGATQYLYRVDCNGWADITGLETEIAAAQRGLSLGMWVNFDNDAGANEEFLIGKWRAAPNARSYGIMRLTAGAGGFIRFSVSLDGTAVVSIDSTTVPTAAGGWYYVAATYSPSSEINIYVNPATPAPEATLAIGVPASLKNSITDFTIGATATPDSYFGGQASKAFLCAAFVSPSLIFQTYQQTRSMFNRI